MSLKNALCLTVFSVISGGSSLFGQLLFTQYYEGASSDKWYEITNVGGSTMDLSAYSVSLFTNGSREDWKSGTDSAYRTQNLSGSLAAGASVLLANSSAATPDTPDNLGAITTTSAVFNGDDSLVLWDNTSTFGVSQIVDALSFTSSNEGQDTSFVRLTKAKGYDLVSGSSIADYPAVWSEVSLASVDNATSGTDNYLGYSSLGAVPEPTTYAEVFGVLALFGVTASRRRRA